MIRNVLLTAAVLYLTAVAGLTVFQRRLLYFPNAGDVAPASVGLPQAERRLLTTPDHQTLPAWRIAPAPGAPVVVYLHGNGGGIDERAARYAAFAAAGFGVWAVEYRGYGGATGSPSEAGLTLDAETAYQAALADAPPGRIAVVGESLGTGLAVKLAARHPVGALALDSPYSSVAEVAAARYPLVPVRWLIADPFYSDAVISEVKAPLLVVAGTQDRVVPIRFARKLFDLARTAKTFITVEGAGHLAMGLRLKDTIAWIAAQIPATPAP